MADELAPHRGPWDPVAALRGSNATRKRARLESPPISSDPPLFSSDDDPSADNYKQERHKIKYKGPWFRQRPDSDAGSLDNGNEQQGKSKRTFERQMDSGVFMGSDGTDVLSDAPEGPYMGSGTLKLAMRMAHVTAAQPSAEELAAGQIQLCLEEGNESIDLSSRGLTTLSNATIRPLATFTCVPPVYEGVFSRIVPKLKIFLASNQLTTLPGELFKLNRLVVLSLRNNQIRELPPSIGKLSNLKELNLSQNGFRYLPFEILDLFSKNSRLNWLNLYPNLFHEPQFLPSAEAEKEEPIQYRIGLRAQTRSQRSGRRGAVCCISPEQKAKSWNAQWKVTYQVRTEVRYLDIDGSLVQGPSLTSDVPPSSQATPYTLALADENYVPTPPAPRSSCISRAPSLLETALAKCVTTAQVPYLISNLPDESPSYLHNLLEFAALKKESGGSQCTICEREFIIPRTEWIEWWEIGKVRDRNQTSLSAASPLRQMENERDFLESMVPLMRRGCSWLCVPSRLCVAEDDAMGDES